LCPGGCLGSTGTPLSAA